MRFMIYRARRNLRPSWPRDVTAALTFDQSVLHSRASPTTHGRHWYAIPISTQPSDFKCALPALLSRLQPNSKIFPTIILILGPRSNNRAKQQNLQQKAKLHQGLSPRNPSGSLPAKSIRTCRDKARRRDAHFRRGGNVVETRGKNRHDKDEAAGVSYGHSSVRRIRIYASRWRHRSADWRT